jgi:hypothetical protein
LIDIFRGDIPAVCHIRNQSARYGTKVVRRPKKTRGIEYFRYDLKRNEHVPFDLRFSRQLSGPE